MFDSVRLFKCTRCTRTCTLASTCISTVWLILTDFDPCTCSHRRVLIRAAIKICIGWVFVKSGFWSLLWIAFSRTRGAFLCTCQKDKCRPSVLLSKSKFSVVWRAFPARVCSIITRSHALYPCGSIRLSIERRPFCIPIMGACNVFITTLSMQVRLW